MRSQIPWILSAASCSSQIFLTKSTSDKPNASPISIGILPSSRRRTSPATIISREQHQRLVPQVFRNESRGHISNSVVQDPRHAVVCHALREVVVIHSAVKPQWGIHPLFWALQWGVCVVPRDIHEQLLARNCLGNNLHRPLCIVIAGVYTTPVRRAMVLPQVDSGPQLETAARSLRVVIFAPFEETKVSIEPARTAVVSAALRSSKRLYIHISTHPRLIGRLAGLRAPRWLFPTKCVE